MLTFRNSLFAIGCGAVLGLSGCATPLDPEITQSAEYQLGYSHGCSTATRQSNGAAGSVVEDRDLMGENKAYTVGWRQGFHGCGGQGTDTHGYTGSDWYIDN